MRVVLLEDVHGLGVAGDVIEVPDDRAREELFPRGLAAAAAGAQTRARARPAAAEAAKADLAATERLVELLDRKSVTLRRPVGPTGIFPTPVTAEDVRGEIEAALGARLPPGTVRLLSPLTEPGEQRVTLNLPHGLEAEVHVIAEGVLPRPGAAPQPDELKRS